MTKREILARFYFIADMGNGVDLIFTEGGREVTVMSYSSMQEAEAFFDEDSIAHWMKALGRTWDDDDFREEPDPFEARYRRQSSEEL